MSLKSISRKDDRFYQFAILNENREVVRNCRIFVHYDESPYYHAHELDMDLVGYDTQSHYDAVSKLIIVIKDQIKYCMVEYPEKMEELLQFTSPGYLQERAQKAIRFKHPNVNL